MYSLNVPYPYDLLAQAQCLAPVKAPVLITGAQGFIGAHLLNLFSEAGVACVGLSSGQYTSSVRLTEKAKRNLVQCDLGSEEGVRGHLQGIATVFHTAAFGAYSWQEDPQLIQRQTENLERLLRWSRLYQVRAFIHLGSSSEYGELCQNAKETDKNPPNSLYSLAKQQCHQLIEYYGRHFQFPCLTLRLFSVYGPLEHPRRLMPNVIQALHAKKTLELSEPKTSRDFIHIYDVLSMILTAATDFRSSDSGEAYNVCSGKSTSLAEVGEVLAGEFQHRDLRWNTSLTKSWDLHSWYGCTQKTFARYQWRPKIDLVSGLKSMAEFYLYRDHLLVAANFLPRKKISVVAPCHMDLPTIPLLFDRIKAVFAHLPYEFEFITIDDLSPDNAFEALKDRAQQDSRWVLAKHTRNMGSQAVFMHALELARGEAVVLMDGDLQDPPEVIPALIEKWEAGYALVLAERVHRDDGFLFTLQTKIFYRLWNILSRVQIPLDCGDFGLITKSAAMQIVERRSREKLWRAQRAYAGLKTALVPYRRPLRAYGFSTNSILKLAVWAYRFIFSTPNWIALIYCLLGVSGALLTSGAMWFYGLWTTLGVGLAITLLTSIYRERFNYPAYTTEKLVQDQTLVFYPSEPKK